MAAPLHRRSAVPCQAGWLLKLLIGPLNADGRLTYRFGWAGGSRAGPVRLVLLVLPWRCLAGAVTRYKRVKVFATCYVTRRTVAWAGRLGSVWTAVPIMASWEARRGIISENTADRVVCRVELQSGPRSGGSRGSPIAALVW